MNNSDFKTSIFQALFFSIFVLGYIPQASAESLNNSYDKFFDGVEIKIENDGSETREVVLPGPVRLRQTKRNGKISTFGVDESGKGAILCSREIFYSVLAVLEACSINGDRKIRARLEWAVREVNKFVAENSIESISIEKMKQSYDLRVGKLKARIASAETDAQSICSANADGFVGKISQQINGQTEDQFRSGVEELLSIPRLPVMNPCL